MTRDPLRDQYQRIRRAKDAAAFDLFGDEDRAAFGITGPDQTSAPSAAPVDPRGRHPTKRPRPQRATRWHGRVPAVIAAAETPPPPSSQQREQP